MGIGGCSRNGSFFAAVVCGLTAAFCVSAQDCPLIHAVVTAVIEGDTLKVQLATGPTVVRLAYIDAPEPRQPGEAEARVALHQHIVGEELALNVLSRDENGWLLAVAFPPPVAWRS